ncbi:MAG TPA: glycoside hydrolase family 76 protein [Ktedonobacteraceae bacterium]
MSVKKWRACLVISALFACLFLTSFVFPRSSASAAGTSNLDFLAYANASAPVLQGWYSTSNGLWNSAWWNSANELGAIIDYSRLSGNTAYTGDIATTFNDNSSGNFLNNYYDDEGWWALTWVNAYDYTGNTTYLNMAKTIFSDMASGWDSTCNGGVWWSKDRTYKNAIPNELFLTLAARLHERTPNDTSYLNWATKEWTWFSGSGMINSSSLINDGLTSSCQNNGGTTWTYNQGVILGGLTDMYKITGNTSYLTKAESIANAATTKLVNANGILEEPCEPAANCGTDGVQFKGIFMRNLAYLYQSDHQLAYENFIIANANSIWQKDRSSSNQLGLKWYGPFDSADPIRQSSAQDALNAAVLFSGGTRGASQAVSQPDGTVDTFYEGTDGALEYNLYVPSNGWSAPTEIAGTANMGSEPSAVRSSPGVMDVFWKGTDGNLWHVFYRPNSGWSTAQNLGMGPLGGAPKAVAAPDGTIGVFWKGTTGNIWDAWYSPSSGWSTTPRQLTTSLNPAFDPAPTTNGNGTWDVYWQGANGNLWHVFSNDNGSSWTAWQLANNGTLGGAPSAMARPDGSIAVFWQGLNDTDVWAALYSPSSGWSGPRKLTVNSPHPASNLAVVNSRPGTWDVYWKGSDGSLWHVFSNNSGSSWVQQDLGQGTLGGGPFATSQPNGAIDIFWKGTGTNPNLWHSFYRPGSPWGGPQNLGGSVA